MLIKLTETSDKKENLKIARHKKHIAHIDSKIRMTVEFLLKMIQDRRQWSKIFKVLKANKNKNKPKTTTRNKINPPNWQLRILHSAKISSRNKS